MWKATQQLDDLAQRYSAQFTLGFSHLWLGNIDEAEKHLLASLASAERTGDVTHQTRCLTYLAILSRKCDQQEKTQQYTSRALSLATALQMVEYTATANANLAWIAWDQKNLSDAEKYGKSALDLWPVTYPFQWTALWPLVAVALTRGWKSRAVGYVRTLLEPTQQRLPAVMATELEAALLKWGNKQSLECQAHLDRAIKLAQESGYL